jgi:hypothetical protein
MSPKC